MATDRLLNSLSNQVEYFTDLINSNNDWEPAGIYVDEAISGTGTEKRSEFKRLINDCERGLIDLVLVKSISRLARNTVDLLRVVRRLKALGVEIFFEEQGISTMREEGEDKYQFHLKNHSIINYPIIFQLPTI